MATKITRVFSALKANWIKATATHPPIVLRILRDYDLGLYTKRHAEESLCLSLGGYHTPADTITQEQYIAACAALNNRPRI